MSLTVEQIHLYTQGWIGKPKAQVAEEIASLSMETKRIPDPYLFVYNTYGKLVSPETGKLVEDSIDKISILGKLEYEGFLLIQELGWRHKKGTILWISPPDPARSKFTKAIVINVLNYPPRLFNRAFMLDLDETGAKNLANKLEWNYIYTNSSQLRKRPIYLPEEFDFSMLPDTKQIEMVESGQDLKSKEEALVWGKIAASDLSNLEKLQEEKVIFGNHDASCPPTAFEVLSGEKQILCCTCPFCGKEVEAEIYDGEIHCPPAPKGCGKKALLKNLS